MRWTIALVVVVPLVAACASAPDPTLQAARDYIKDVTGDDLKAAGAGLRVGVRTAVSDGRTVRINGTIENRFDQPVEGVRYTVRFVAAGDPPRVIDTFHQGSADTVLDPGEDRAMRIEIENPVRATAPGRFAIEAEPMRLGGRDLPPPPGWKQRQL